jgi:hypothetical protein
MMMTNIDHQDFLTAQGLFDNRADEILYQRWLDEISSKDYDERIEDETRFV